VFVTSLAARRHRLLFSLRAEKFTLKCMAEGGDDIYKRMKGILAHHTTKPTYCKGYGMGLSCSSGATVARYVLRAAINMSSAPNLCLQRWSEWTVERRRGQFDLIRIQRLLELRTRTLGLTACLASVSKVTSALWLPLTFGEHVLSYAICIRKRQMKSQTVWTKRIAR
jgi:hypothetical protein